MDDFVVSNLYESRNEWCSRLVSVLSPCIIEGIYSIYEEALKMCIENNENSKYLMTFQSLLSRIPQWNETIIENEKTRITEKSNCNYLEDLITCVHIIQLKILTCVRVGNKQKKVDIAIPKINTFIHKVYIQVARKIYSNTYLYDNTITKLQKQKYSREIERIIHECIVITIRESIPTEDIIRAYTEESVEHDEETIIEEQIITPIENKIQPVTEIILPVNEIKMETNDTSSKLTFNDYDNVLDSSNKSDIVCAPKTLARLEEISISGALQRKMDASGDTSDDDVCSIKISTDTDNIVVLNDVTDLTSTTTTNSLDPISVPVSSNNDDSEITNIKINDENIILTDVEILS